MRGACLLKDSFICAQWIYSDLWYASLENVAFTFSTLSILFLFLSLSLSGFNSGDGQGWMLSGNRANHVFAKILL